MAPLEDMHMPARTRTLTWRKGDNGHQEYYALQGRRKYDVVRNHQQDYWVIYSHTRSGTRMVPNPFPVTAQLRFVEVTRLPHAGERFGDHPGDDILPDTLSPNYAWDRAEDAQHYVENSLALGKRL